MAKVIGFDFGTTNSLISIIEGEKVINLFEVGGRPHPSVVSYEGDQIVVGRKAKQELSQPVIGVSGHIVRSPKALLGRESVNVQGVARSPKDIVAEVVKFVKAEALGSGYPGVYDQAVVTMPINMIGKRRAELRDAFLKAGIGIVQFVHEPLAAFYGHLRSQPDVEENLRQLNGELVFVFDWGGGTVDLTICRVLSDMLVQIANAGSSDLGGDHIDAAIRNYVVKRFLQDRGINKDVEVQTNADAGLLERVEQAKIKLSGKDSALIYVPNYFKALGDDGDLEYMLSREELEEICQPFVKKAVNLIYRVLDKAHVDPNSIAMSLATGGMVHIPCIESGLLEIFGPARLKVSERGDAIIAEGAAWFAHDGLRLTLAKNAEILASGNSYFPVIKAGSPMPREGECQTEELSLYCSDPRDGFAKIQFCAPLIPGKPIASDERRVLENLSIRVHGSAHPFRERICLSTSIDENLILTASGKSLMEKDQDHIEVHDLEFGLEIVLPKVVGSGNGSGQENASGLRRPAPPGSVSLRANVSNEKDWSLVPGELMGFLANKYPMEFGHYFGTRRHIPERQRQEKSYYDPCAICGRASNELCDCAKMS